MLDDYSIEGPSVSLEVKVEKSVVEQVGEMAKHMRIGTAEIVNVALKRFIATHKDFLPKAKSGSSK